MIHSLSKSQLEGYIRCIKNIECGDTVIYYTNKNGNVLDEVSEYYDRAKVVLVSKTLKISYGRFFTIPKIFIAGMSDRLGDLGGYCHDPEYKNLLKLPIQIRQENRFRFLDSSMYIKQIIKPKS